MKARNKCFFWFRIALLGILAATAGIYLYRDELRDFTVDDTRFSKEITRAARQYGLDPSLVRAVVFQESRFDPDCRGSRGEIGLMQLMPSGAAAEWARVRKCSVPDSRELFKPEINLDIGCWYLARAMRRWAGHPNQLELALCQYNAGPTRAKKWAEGDTEGAFIERISIHSTRHYVKRIIKRYRHYKQEKS